jgi:amino acid transporter
MTTGTNETRHSDDAAAKPRRMLSTTRVVFLVIAAAAPMAAMVGNVPLAIIRGNGAGLPAAFVIAAVVLLCFCVGYAAMTKRVVNSGAFYLLVARGIGKPPAIAVGYIAALGYAALSFGLAAAFGYFTNLVLSGLGVNLPWYVYTAFAILFVAFFGYRSADLSAKVLGALMILEFTVLIVFDVFAVHKLGPAALPLASFSPGVAFSGSLGIALMFAFISFVGFESTALYGEDTKDPARSIPRASYIAVGSISVFYILTSWIIIGAAGGLGAPALAKKQLGNLIFVLVNRYGGEVLYDLSAILLCTSLLASFLALHNAAARYLFVLGRERVLPVPLSRYHPRHLSPHVASLVLTLISIVVIGAFTLGGADPYTVTASSLIGLGTLGIVGVQSRTALSVLAFFWRRSDRTLWGATIAPIVGFIGLAVAFVLAAANYEVLSGSTVPAVNAVPLLIVLVAIVGVVVSLRLRAKRPALYAQLASSELRRRSGLQEALEPVAYSRRYCVVGAGPSGMIMARALMREGVPFDWYEKHSGFGGIWDADNPGSPMYESAHFISSKYTSGFYGDPMPAEFPDYPRWQQIRDYITGFGNRYHLESRVTFNTEVVAAQPLEHDRWAVTLSNGSIHEYDGLICAPGVTWHANTPTLAGQSHFTGELRHSQTFSDGIEFRGRRVLIVGAGNSGVDIASDAARHADTAFISVRRGYRYIPKHIGGLPTDAVLNGIIDPPKGLSLSGDTNQLIDALVGDLTRFGLPAPDHDALASHPIMNTQVLHHLAHGDLIAKPDIDHLTKTGVVFADGSEEQVDVILLATGYEYRIPFLDPALLEWKQGHPQLYLNVFSRQHDSLYVLGFIEFADAAYKRFDEMAQLVVMDIRARETGVHRTEIRALKATDRPDLRGGIEYIDSPRHANYVEAHTYGNYLAEIRDRFGWPDLGETSYDSLLGAEEPQLQYSPVQTGALST